jgi:hypothetical protein
MFSNTSHIVLNQRLEEVFPVYDFKFGFPVDVGKAFCQSCLLCRIPFYFEGMQPVVFGYNQVNLPLLGISPEIKISMYLIV